MICTAHYPSPVGDLLLAGRDERLLGLWIEGQKYYFDLPADTVAERETPVLAQTKLWLDRYFAGARPLPGDLPLSPVGTPFRQAVWALLCEIPYGAVTTYGELARTLAVRTGSKPSARAVGGAVGHNPISILIPCHRVVGADGSLTGYAGGLAIKQALLTHEGADLTRIYPLSSL